MKSAKKLTTDQKIKECLKNKWLRIDTLDELEDACENNRAVVFNLPMKGQRPMPAKVFINMTGRCILARLRKGTYIYRK
jgi:hypothetical protein